MYKENYEIFREYYENSDLHHFDTKYIETKGIEKTQLSA
jgi:hypothetical protein